MMYKMVVFDIDGTLIPYEKTSLHKNIKKMFKRLKENNIIVCLATGRDFVSIGNIYKDENIDFFIGANGSFIFDNRNKKSIFNSSIKYDDFEKYYEEILLTNQSEINNVILSDDKFVYVWNNQQLDGHWFWDPFKNKFKEFDDAKNNINRSQFHLITINCATDSKLIEITKEYFNNKKDLSIHMQAWWRNGFFVANKGITKAHSIEKLCHYLNIKMDNVIAFGDGENDLQMLKEVGLGVAMGNGSDTVKEIAKDVTSNVEEFGTIIYLEKIGLI